MLAVVHVGIAGITNTPEMALEDDEARLLAEAAVPVLDQFDFTPDPRFAAAFGLVVASARVYGPRYVLIRARKAKEAEDERAKKARPVGPSQNAAANGAPFQPDLTATLGTA